MSFPTGETLAVAGGAGRKEASRFRPGGMTEKFGTRWAYQHRMNILMQEDAPSDPSLVSSLDRKSRPSVGKHAATDGKISVELSIPDKKHIKFRVSLEAERLEEGLRKVVSVWNESLDDQFSVAAQQWAFYFGKRRAVVLRR